MKAQDLKNSILQLAIQGKLVPQNSDDETAEVLYTKIQAEKENLIKEGKIKKSKPLPPITEEEIPFEIPSNWKWIRLGDVASIVPTKKYQILQSEINKSGIYPVVSQSLNLIEGFSNDSSKLYDIDKPVLVFGDHTKCLKHINFSFVVGADGVKIINPIIMNDKFLFYLLEYIKINIRDRGYSRHFQFLSAPILPLPPLAEQHRIVEKIEELLPFINDYDKAEVKLTELNKNFPEQIKKSVLQYAIEGKLVPQNSDDESAEVLYAKIQAEKEKLIKEGKIKKSKPLPPITEEEIPFPIPSTWKWVRLGDIVIINPRNNVNDDMLASFIPMNLIDAGYGTNNSSDVRIWKELKNGFTHFQENDIAIAKITPCFQNRKSCILKELKNNIGAGTTELHIVRAFSSLSLKYLLYIFKSDNFIKDGIKNFTGTAGQQRINKDFLTTYPIPLPPLAEQHRIVEKIEEFFNISAKL